MYRTDWDVGIQRANLDGSAVEDLVITSLDNPYGIALVVAGGKIYWTDAGAPTRFSAPTWTAAASATW